MSTAIPPQHDLERLGSDLDGTMVGGKRSSAPPNSDPVVGRVEEEQSSRRSASSRRATQRPLSESAADDSSSAVSRYEERQEIGRGGCGVVIRAYDRLMQREVVIKRVLPDSQPSRDVVARFWNEARITGRLEHPGIVPVHEIGTDLAGGQPYYVMKWLQGTTLSDVIAQLHHARRGQGQRRKLHELLHRFHQVCQTLAYAHGLHIIHRDLKPANIMVGQFGETIVLDWGLAKDLQETCSSVDPHLPHEPSNHADHAMPTERRRVPRISSQSGSHSANRHGLTRTGTIMGTAAYMSPEQARGESRAVDCRSDVFSLGVILYEILSGTSPFRADQLQGTLQKVAKGDFIPLRKLAKHTPRALDAICNRALEFDPKDRYSDAGALATDLANFLSGDAVSAYREPWWGRLDRIAGKHRTIVRASFVAMFLVAMVSIVGAAKIHQSRLGEIAAREEAEHESHERGIAHARERQAHAKSLSQLQSARKSVDAWLIELSGDLQFYPGLEGVRDQLLNRARRYYAANVESALQAADSIGESSRDVTQDVLEVARSEIRLGDIARLSHQDAEPMYASAFARLQDLKLDPNHPAMDDVRIQSVNATLGRALCDSKPSGSVERGRELADRAVAMATSLLANIPSDRDATKAWLRSKQLAARFMDRAGLHAKGAESLGEPIERATQLFENSDEPSEFFLNTSLIADQAKMQEEAKQWSLAAENYHRLIDIYSHSLKTQSARPDRYEARAHAKTRLGNCLTQMLSPAQALAEYQEAQEDLKESWNLLFEDSYLQENIAIANINLGSALRDSGDRSQAESALRSAIAQLQEVIRRNGSPPDRIQRMAQAFLALADVLSGSQSDEFSKLIRDAGILLDHLNQTDPKGTDDQDGSQRSSLESQRQALIVAEAMRIKDSP